MADIEEQKFSLAAPMLVYLCLQRVVYLMVDKPKLDACDEKLRSYALNATPGLIDRVGICMSAAPDEVFCFTEEASYLRGRGFLTKQRPEFKDQQYGAVCISPRLLFKKASDCGCRVIRINEGSPQSASYVRQNFEQLLATPDLVQVAGKPKLFLFLKDDQTPLETRVGNDKYVHAFFTELLAYDDVQNSTVPLRKAEVRVAEIIDQTLESNFFGLAVRLDDERQCYLNKLELQRLKLIVDLIGPVPWWSKEYFRRAIRDLLPLAKKR